jgi:hypothetical protein
MPVGIKFFVTLGELIKIHTNIGIERSDQTKTHTRLAFGDKAIGGLGVSQASRVRFTHRW